MDGKLVEGLRVEGVIEVCEEVDGKLVEEE